MQDEDKRGREEQPGVQPSYPSIGLDELPEALGRAARRMGWAQLMPVQAKTIPFVLSGRDLMVQSRTGSGKTGAFLLPILQLIDTSRAVCQAIVLVPTRELALQVSREAEAMAAETEVRSVVLYGGVGYGAQLDGLRRGAHIVVGTPGRLLDHLLRGTLRLDDLKILVFDEADRLLSVGFYPDMKQLGRYLPQQRSGYMFSATYTSRVLALAREFLQSPEFLSLSTDAVHVAETEHIYHVVPSMDRDRCLVRVIEIENPDSAIVFCNTKALVNFVTQVLQRFGYDAEQLTADLPQREREEVLAQVRAGRLRFLVATDIAARGIDIIGLSHVILYDFPEDPESYIHRVGRTGRAGAAGVAISLVDVLEEGELKKVAARFNIPFVNRPAPTDDDVEAMVTQRVTAMLESKLRSRDRMHVERMQRFVPLARALGESEDEASVIAMLLDDYYQEILHAPAGTGIPDPQQGTEGPGGKSGGSRRPPGGGGAGRRRRRRSSG